MSREDRGALTRRAQHMHACRGSMLVTSTRATCLQMSAGACSRWSSVQSSDQSSHWGKVSLLWAAWNFPAMRQCGSQGGAAPCTWVPVSLRVALLCNTLVNVGKSSCVRPPQHSARTPWIFCCSPFFTSVVDHIVRRRLFAAAAARHWRPERRLR